MLKEQNGSTLNRGADSGILGNGFGQKELKNENLRRSDHVIWQFFRGSYCSVKNKR